jgi:hypothetical protein
VKLTLEFEENDLRKMIVDHFVREGFLVKNLNTVCQQFLQAFPDGLRIEADIAPMSEQVEESVSEDSVATPIDRHVVYTSDADADAVAIDEVPVDSTEPLTLTDLMDPTPRMRRSETSRPSKPVRILSSVDDVGVGIESIVRQSRNMEKRPK